MRAKQITSFTLNGIHYEHRDYGNGQDRYTKTEKICPMSITKQEFQKAKEEKEK